jgi:hypothetical protein
MFAESGSDSLIAFFSCGAVGRIPAPRTRQRSATPEIPTAFARGRLAPLAVLFVEETGRDPSGILHKVGRVLSARVAAIGFSDSPVTCCPFCRVNDAMTRLFVNHAGHEHSCFIRVTPLLATELPNLTNASEWHIPELRLDAARRLPALEDPGGICDRRITFRGGRFPV